MPLLVNSSVGSLRGTSGEEGTTSWPSRAKKSRKVARMSLLLAMAAASLANTVREGSLQHVAQAGRAGKGSAR